MTRRRKKKSANAEGGSATGAAGGSGQGAAPGVGRRMLMNVIDPGEIRVAILGPGGLEQVFFENAGGEYVHGNIFKGKVQNIEPNLQAAFIDIGSEKNGFLHVRDIVPPFGGYDGILKRRRRKAPENTHNMPIDQMLYVGQEILVQITREAVSTKGPSVTTYISLPGRYLVLMPAVAKRGVSRKIEDDKERGDLKQALDQLNPPKDMGFIIRTAGMGKGREELQLDLDYLTRLWEAIGERTKKVKAPSAIYQESDLVIRAIRDYFSEDISELIIDSAAEYERAAEFLSMVMPEMQDRIKLYEEEDPLFNHFGAESEIEKLFTRSVRLKSGGELVIEQTEAMVTIDVNTGRYLKGESSREMLLQINKEAAVEIARQLRLRDLGGLVMIDFIDMERQEDRREVENVLRQAMQVDRARATMLPISALGVMEMTRQRVRKSLHGTHYDACPFCRGTGLLKNAHALGLELLRRIKAALDNRTTDLLVRLHPVAALPVANQYRSHLAEMEAKTGRKVIIQADPTIGADEIYLSD